MLKRLLLAVDGTPSAKMARSFAFQWAQRQNAEVTGLAVLDADVMAGPEAVPLGGSTFKARRDERHLAAARAYLEAELKAFSSEADQHGVRAMDVFVTGVPAPSIVAEVDINDVVVLGRTTTFDQGNEAKGLEVVIQLLGSAPRPVVVVPDDALVDGDVLVAFDGSVPAVRALQLFALLGGAWRDRAVTVISIDETAGKAERLAMRAASFLIAHDYRATPKPIVTPRTPVDSILDTAKALRPGLIVQGAYGNRTWLDFLLGSTTSAMLKEAKAPLFMSH
jgi:nucleotide-binding universal stress UspA family protein